MSETQLQHSKNGSPLHRSAAVGTISVRSFPPPPVAALRACSHLHKVVQLRHLQRMSRARLCHCCMSAWQSVPGLASATSPQRFARRPRGHSGPHGMPALPKSQPGQSPTSQCGPHDASISQKRSRAGSHLSDTVCQDIHLRCKHGLLGFGLGSKGRLQLLHQLEAVRNRLQSPLCRGLRLRLRLRFLLGLLLGLPFGNSLLLLRTGCCGYAAAGAAGDAAAATSAGGANQRRTPFLPRAAPGARAQRRTVACSTPWR